MKRSKNYYFYFLVAVLALSSVRVSALPAEVILSVDIIDPTDETNNPHRNPIPVPEVSIEDYTLFFDTPCDGLELRLVNEDNEVEYITVITGSTLVLPSYLSGDYELQIISGNIVFYGDISL